MDSVHAKKGPLQRIKSFFITTVIGGFIVILPIGLLVGVLQFLYNFLTGLISPMRALIGFLPDVRVWVVNIVSIITIVITQNKRLAG